MMDEFIVYDPQKTGKVTKENFLAVMETFNLHLTGENLDRFLSRFGLDERLSHVNYFEFVQRLQSRRGNDLSGGSSVTAGRRLEKRKSSSALTTASILEEKLIKLFHTDFNSLCDTFRRADTKQINIISQQDFKAILETRYAIKLTDDEFMRLLEKLPTDGYGGIRYLDFIARFDSSDDSLSLYDGSRSVVTEYSRRLNSGSALPKARSLEQLAAIIKNLVRNHYSSLELAYNQVDSMNTRRLTVESLYQLLKRCEIRPQISREEIGKIWDTLILNQDCTVEFFQFIRHFGFSPKSSCFPNANISPPVRGDGDCLIRSNKLNSDTKIIANMLQSKVKLFLDKLWIQFRESDPTNTGYVTKDEFLNILQELSPDLTQHQCDSMAAKFGDGHNRVSYVEFLQPYQPRQSLSKKNRFKATKKEVKVISTQESVQHGLNAIPSKLKDRLSRVDWKNLHQTCQKLDRDGSGFLHFSQFQSVIKLCNIVLDEDDIYQVMAQYDKDLCGKLNYSKLVSDLKTK
ncbi:EF-hand calcium-binding domain-containing protein 6-like [Pelobates fuscus]|uniref:EF-hand calcium-binding domain-containing protein 6-like n=1 Tax=Pelobates fuscus TaxID=191477 RepID=UPI002FE4C446